LKVPMKAALTMPTNGDGDVPPEGITVGRSSARCRFRGRGAGVHVSVPDRVRMNVPRLVG
jgi:hypothetical protein